MSATDRSHLSAQFRYPLVSRDPLHRTPFRSTAKRISDAVPSNASVMASLERGPARSCFHLRCGEERVRDCASACAVVRKEYWALHDRLACRMSELMPVSFV